MPLLGGDLACRRAQAPELAWQPDGGWTEEASPPARSVYFKRLQAFLPPSVPGFKRVRDEGSTGRYGDVSVSEAERIFAQDDGRELVIRIVDSTMLDRLAEGIRIATLEATRVAEDTTRRIGTVDGATRPIGRADSPPREATPANRAEIAGALKLPDAVGYFRYDPAEARADANLLVGDRFIVSIAGRGFQGSDEVRRIAQGLDCRELSKLR